MAADRQVLVVRGPGNRSVDRRELAAVLAGSRSRRRAASIRTTQTSEKLRVARLKGCILSWRRPTAPDSPILVASSQGSLWIRFFRIPASRRISWSVLRKHRRISAGRGRGDPPGRQRSIDPGCSGEQGMWQVGSWASFTSIRKHWTRRSSASTCRCRKRVLHAIDRAAEQAKMSRSGFLAEAGLRAAARR